MRFKFNRSRLEATNRRLTPTHDDTHRCFSYQKLVLCHSEIPCQLVPAFRNFCPSQRPIYQHLASSLIRVSPNARHTSVLHCALRRFAFWKQIVRLSSHGDSYSLRPTRISNPGAPVSTVIRVQLDCSTLKLHLLIQHVLIERIRDSRNRHRGELRGCCDRPFCAFLVRPVRNGGCGGARHHCNRRAIGAVSSPAWIWSALFDSIY